MRHMLGNLSPNYFERTKRYMMLRASQQGTDLTVSGTPPLSLPNSLGKPLKTWSVDLLPYQEGTGDPAPDNVRPIHGTNKLNLFVADSYDQTATPTAVIDVPPLSANQWDEEWEVGEINNQGEFSTSTTVPRVVSKNFIPVISSELYYCYFPNSVGNYNRVFYYNKEKQFLSYENVSSAKTITVPSDTAFIKFHLTGNYGTTYLHNIAINYPSSVTTYNPYNATVYTGTIGSEGGESRWGKAVLDGTQTGILANWRATETSVGVLFPYNTLRNKVSESDIIPPNILSDTLPTITYQVAYNGTVDIGISAVTGASVWGLCIRLPDPTLTTDALVNQYLAEHPITVVYELATPTTFAVPSVTIPTPTGTATTWATAEDGTVDSMEVTYVGKA